jgi:transporter family-2 protein
MPWGPIGFVLLAASFLPIQAACNGALNRALGRPVLVVMVSLAGSLVFMSATGLISGRLGLVPADRFARVPPWAWLAGVCGAIYLLSQPIAAPRLRAALYMSLAVTGQVATAVVLDHFGLLNLPQHPASPGRVLGVVLIAAGVSLVAWF